MRFLLLILLLVPSVASAGEALELGEALVPLPGSELIPLSQSEAHVEAKDGKTGWTWRLDEVGAGRLRVYPERLSVRDKVARRDGLQGLTELEIVPMALGLGTLYGGATQTESVRTCFLGRGGSVWVLTMRSPKAMIERSELALRAACKEATLPPRVHADPASAVGLLFDPRAPMDFLPNDSIARAVSFGQSATDLSGAVFLGRKEGHPYNTDDAAELARALAKDGFKVTGTEVMRAAGQDAPRLELTRTTTGGGETRWLMVLLRGEESIWVVQSPVRSLGYAKLKGLFDLMLTNARLLEK